MRHHFRMLRIAVLVIPSAIAALTGWAAGAGSDVTAVAAMLAKGPEGVAPPISDRASWNAAGVQKALKSYLDGARKVAQSPIPEQPDDLFLEFSRNGNRSRWQAVAGRRRERVRQFALAECLENKGDYLKPLEAIITALCEEKTWVMPAHDRSLTNFNGKAVDIDLASSALGWELATVDWLLGDRLTPSVRTLLRDNVHRRVIDPYLDMVAGRRDKNWWMTTTNNWNAVCTAGVTGAGLVLLESAEDRAQLIVAAQRNNEDFLRGFGKDGYCSEGLGYWGYGFGNYVFLSKTVFQATGGKIDMLARPDAREAALFATRIEIMNGVYPAIADCSVTARPDAAMMAELSFRFGLGLRQFESQSGVGGSNLPQILQYVFPDPAAIREAASAAVDGLPERAWFASSGVLICRPGKDGTARLAVAMKGGDNNEHHNHNDVGTYVVVVGKSPVLIDPGSEVYTARTFSSKRYDSNLLNSFGHAVPVVAGKLQSTGSKAQGKVLKSEFTEDADTLVLDLASAYAVPELTALTRTFVYSRIGAGSLTITDEVTFSKPCEFATALITLGDWKELAPPGMGRVTDGKDAVNVAIATDGPAFTLHADTIDEDGHTKTKPTRIGINLAAPVQRAKITVVITPAE